MSDSEKTRKRTEPGVDLPVKIKKKAYDLFRQGYGYRASARILQLSIYTTREWKRQYDAGFFNPQRGFHRTKRVFTDEFRHKVVETMQRENLTLNETAFHFQLTRRTVSQWIERVKQEQNPTAVPQEPQHE